MAVKTRRATSATTTAHEDFYKRLRERVSGWAQKGKINPKYKEYVLALPDLFHLVVKLLLDKRVDATSKAVLGVAIAWALSPIDLLPDMLGPLGLLDDLLVLVLALDFMLDRTPRAVVEEHWAGTGDVFTIIRSVLDRADDWMGRGLYQRVRALMARKTAGPAAAAARKPAAARAAAAPKRRVTKRAPPARPKAAARPRAAAATAPAKAAAPKRARPAPRRAARRKS